MINYAVFLPAKCPLVKLRLRQLNGRVIRPDHVAVIACDSTGSPVMFEEFRMRAIRDIKKCIRELWGTLSGCSGKCGIAFVEGVKL